MKADVLLFPSMTCRGPLGGQGIANFDLNFWYLFGKIQKSSNFKVKLTIPRPPNGPLVAIFGKINTSAFTGKKLYLYLFLNRFYVWKREHGENP